MSDSLLLGRIKRVLRSKVLFAVILSVFVFQCLWLALSARYPMAFDENYHYGIIQVYSRQSSPFIKEAPPHTESLGDITRYPSYLFHYLMSFPYRVSDRFTDSDQTKIIILRLMNIGFFAAALVYFRRLLLLARAGPIATNVTLLFFTLIPNVIFLAAQINYDNLLVLCTALILLWSLQFLGSAKKGQFDSLLYLRIGTLNLMTSLMIFTHLPTLFSVQLFITMAALYYGHTKKKPVIKSVTLSFSRYKSKTKWLLVIGFILACCLFIERYGVNLVRFNNLIPHCGQILPAESCQQYGPWGRDNNLMQKPPSTWSAGRYFFQWAGQNMYEFFFTINHNYFNTPPFMLPFVTTWILTILGTLLALLHVRKLAKNQAFVFFMFVIAVFAISLWVNNLNRFRTVGFPVAIHGRYWVQLLPIIMVLMAVGFKYTLLSLPKRFISPTTIGLLAVSLLFFSQGGGISSYIVESDASWYWQDAHVVEANNSARSILQKTVIVR